MTATATQQRASIPRVAALSVAGGLVLMAVFTGLWASWSLPGLPFLIALPILALFILFAIAFLIEAIVLFAAARRFPVSVADASPRPPGAGQPRSANRGAWFGAIFTAEGVVIFVICAILGKTGLTDFINPAIALIVGLHFIPLAKIFERTLDYYVATWFILAALIGIALIAIGSLPTQLVWSLVGIAAACGTSVYGFYMIGVKRSLLAQQ